MDTNVWTTPIMIEPIDRRESLERHVIFALVVPRVY